VVFITFVSYLDIRLFEGAANNIRPCFWIKTQQGFLCSAPDKSLETKTKRTMKLPLNYWLETIADDTIRESAIRQWDKEVTRAESLRDAVALFSDWVWTETDDNNICWDNIHTSVIKNKLALRPYTSPEGHTFNPDTGEWTMPAADHLPIREDKTAEVHDNTEVIEVTSCEDCPLTIYLNRGFYACRYDNSNKEGGISECPANGTVLDFCPLKSKQITVKLK